MHIVSLSRAAADWLEQINVECTVVSADDGAVGPDWSHIQDLDPDLVIAATIDQAHALRLELGVANFTFAPTTFREILSLVLSLGRRVDRSPRMMRLVGDLERSLATARAAAGITKHTVPAGRAVILRGPESNQVAGFWAAEILELAGAEPVIHQKGAPHADVGADALRSAQPDHVVIDVGTKRSDDHPLILPSALPARARLVALPATLSIAEPGPSLYYTIERLIVEFRSGP